MKKVILLCLLTCFTVPWFGYGDPISIKKVRKLYLKASNSEKACKKIIKLLVPYSARNNPLLLGYRVSATMMMASYTWNPFKKLSYFNEGKHMLIKAIKAKRKNVELRFLRLAAQVKAPSFLGYDDFIESDVNFLKRKLPKIENINLENFIIQQLKNLHLNRKIILPKSAKSS